MHEMLYLQTVSAVSAMYTIYKAELIRITSRFKTSATPDFKPTELCMTEYITKRICTVEDSPELLSEQAINWIRAAEAVQLETMDVNISESLLQAEKLAKICNLNKTLVAKDNHLEAVEAIQDGQSKELVAAQQEINEFEELQMEKYCSANLERQLNYCKSKPEVTALGKMTLRDA
jgi:hypothetical protein